MKIEISTLDSRATTDMIHLIEVFKEVFGTEYDTPATTDHLQKLLSKDSFYAVVARERKKIVGGLIIHILDQYYSNKPVGYIYDLAVLVEYQRQGIGSRLIEFTREHCRNLDCEEIFVQVEKVDFFALDFYRSTRVSEEDAVVHFTYDLMGEND